MGVALQGYRARLDRKTEKQFATTASNYASRMARLVIENKPDDIKELCKEFIAEFAVTGIIVPGPEKDFDAKFNPEIGLFNDGIKTVEIDVSWLCVQYGEEPMILSWPTRCVTITGDEEKDVQACSMVFGDILYGARRSLHKMVENLFFGDRWAKFENEFFKMGIRNV